MSPDQNTTSEDPTAYEDFVKREEEDFKKSKGCASIKYEDFFTHQVTLLDEKTKEVEFQQDKIDAGDLWGKLPTSDQARQDAEEAQAKTMTDFKTLLKERDLRVKLLNGLQSSRDPFNTNAVEGASGQDTERERKRDR